MDEAERMELALNSNFDSALLDDYWAEAAADQQQPSQEDVTNASNKEEEDEEEEDDDMIEDDDDDVDDDDDDDDIDDSDIQSSTYSRTSSSDQQQRHSASLEGDNIMEQDLGYSGALSSQSNNTMNPSSFDSLTQLHPLGIQSSANCPPHETIMRPSVLAPGNAGAADARTGQPIMGMTTTSNLLQQQLEALPLHLQQNPALLPLALNALAAGANFASSASPAATASNASNTPPPSMGVATGPNLGQTSNVGATSASASNAAAQPMSAVAAGTPQQGNISIFPPGASGLTTSEAHVAHSNHPFQTYLSAQSQRATQPAQPIQPRSANCRASGATETGQTPPFLLFDAPIELRMNFQQCLRANGLPLLQDNNSYHFGVAVNGFHPQGLHAPSQKFGSIKHPTDVRLIDARHGDLGDKRLKNAKEQRRAQRIAELIDELRQKMEDSGWKLGTKSKFHTLSS